MMNKELGFDKENLLFARIKSPQRKINFEDVRNGLLKHPEIIDACMSETIPFNGSDGFDPDWEGSQTDERINCRINSVSYDFSNTLKLEIILGRDFSRDYKMDAGKSCLINETAWKRFGWKDPIGKRLSNSRFQVIGVVKDYHVYSIHEKIPPLVIVLNNSTVEGSWIYSFRVAPGRMKSSIKIINEELESYFPTDPFDLHIFSEFFKKDGTFKIYNSINVTFIFFAVLTILLAVIGLLGLVSFTVKRKTKEIGIRKVHGSSIAAIFLKLTLEYIILVFIAALITCPASFYFFQVTLPTAYKASMQLWEFIAATSIVLLITILATSFHSIRAAFTNPVEALRYE
jgi:putative ABC transport system permease protein